MQRELLDVRRRLLGLEHPDTLATMNNLGTSLGYQGKHAEAEQMQRELLELQRRVLGPEHPETLATTSNHGCGASTHIDNNEQPRHLAP
jgi:hypothetical protein